MSWLASIFVGALCGVVACLGTGLIADVCVGWYRIPGREGESGYFVIGLALLGACAGLAVGVVCSRVVAASPSASFLKGLGVSSAVTLGLLGAGAGLAWLEADFPPTLDGRELEIAVEVRCSAGFALPREDPARGLAHVTVTADSGARRQSSGGLRFAEARSVEGRWIVPGTVLLTTSDPGKSLGVGFGDHKEQYFRWPLASKPSRRDMAWSAWLADPHFGDLSAVPAAEAISVRYRVQFFSPPPSPPAEPTEKEREAAARAQRDGEFAALTPDSPIESWLPFTRYGEPEERRVSAAAAIAKRAHVTAEMSRHIRSADPADADLALRAVALMAPPPADLVPVVREVGGRIASEIREANATTPTEDPTYERAAAVDVRFAGWADAASVLHDTRGADFRPVVREIGDLARVRGDSSAMKDVARVSSFYLDAWATLEPRRR